MKLIDLFAGCGGLSTGFEMGGFEVVLAIEKDLWASETYKFNHPDTKVITADLTSISDINSYLEPNIEIDGIIGGPPCQGFSLSGNRDKNDPRNSLFMEFVRFVKTIKPKFFVMENVPGLLSMKTSKNENVVELILSEFKKAGYNTSYKILNAADFGVPQTRKRVLFIGLLDELCTPFIDRFPEVQIQKDDYVSIGDAILDLRPIQSGEGVDDDKYFTEPLNDYQKWARMNSSRVYNHIAMRHTKRLIERFATIKQGQSLADVEEKHMMRKRGDASKISGKTYSQNNMRPFIDKPSPTIAASFQGNFIHPLINRNYTAREAARLQSFPDSYIFKGKRTTMSWEKHLSQYQQIGNAVPPLLAKAVATKIKKILTLSKDIK
ncbi:DNA cytosine methyltransferase [Mycoplasmopsis mucosicanis]|uniref:Cytosine-specific methyltransferase n=1 Tax=Mycoplasmopsis mucosicanis TaxID=458208 RepID=A0A507SM76_9BACT|nr:DNA cytosine methyltransferase [Mycoplasmopsis mucosicanis]TQC51315.1 DNA cytosine methyltransferase [Mycoplasmopsis mucosicanis]